MNDPELDRITKEKMQKYVPYRSFQVLHCVAIVLVSFAIGIFNLSTEPAPAGVSNGDTHQMFGPWLGVYLAVSGLAVYFIWTYFRAAKARREARAEFLTSSRKIQ